MNLLRAHWRLLVIGALTVIFVVLFARQFPWADTGEVLADASIPLLLLATLVNLTSLNAKGWAWHLLLKPSAPHRFGSAQIATFVGAAANCLSISVGGEAARIHVLHQRDGVSYGAGAASVLASRVVEAVALVLFVAIATLFVPTSAWITTLRIISWSVLVAVLLVWRFQWLQGAARRLPDGAQRWLAPLLADDPRPALAVPILLGFYNWIAEWGTYWLALEAAGLHLPPSAALVGLLAANIGGIPRLTPANVGVMQAAMVVALDQYGVPMATAVAAGLVLQAVQTLPVIAVGVVLAGTDTLRYLFGRPAAAPGASAGA